MNRGFKAYGVGTAGGHRTSVDLDFFSNDAVDENALLSDLRLANVTVISKAPETLHLHINATKVSFPGYHYPALFPFHTFAGVKIADPRDIGAMKVAAVTSRGAKRDFVDLYFLAQRYIHPP